MFFYYYYYYHWGYYYYYYYYCCYCYYCFVVIAIVVIVIVVVVGRCHSAGLVGNKIILFGGGAANSNSVSVIDLGTGLVNGIGVGDIVGDDVEIGIGFELSRPEIGSGYPPSHSRVSNSNNNNI